MTFLSKLSSLNLPSKVFKQLAIAAENFMEGKPVTFKNTRRYPDILSIWTKEILPLLGNKNQPHTQWDDWEKHLIYTPMPVDEDIELINQDLIMSEEEFTALSLPIEDMVRIQEETRRKYAEQLRDEIRIRRNKADGIDVEPDHIIKAIEECYRFDENEKTILKDMLQVHWSYNKTTTGNSFPYGNKTPEREFGISENALRLLRNKLKDAECLDMYTEKYHNSKGESFSRNIYTFNLLKLSVYIGLSEITESDED